jgi:hypothetical protein
MDHSRGLVLNRIQAPGIHIQHPDQPPCAATLPQTHPLKTRIATLLQVLHFMRDWQANPFYRGFRHRPLVPFSRRLGLGLLSDPEMSDTHGAAAGLLRLNGF